MHWTSFYVNPEDIQHNELLIREEEVHHLSRVLRRKKGDIVWAVDGQGTAYKVEILYVSRTEARAKIIQTRRLLGEPITEITLAQGLLKGDKFDWIVEKTTEIGIRRIIPFRSEHSETAASPQKLARWQRIALTAMKQSGRSILPEISPEQRFEQIVGLGAQCRFRYIAHSGTSSKSLSKTTPLLHPQMHAQEWAQMRSHLRERTQVSPKVFLIIGSEGGFTDQEMELAVDHGFHAVSLGPRRFRAETAAIVFSALVMFQLGDLE